jgi:N-acetylgalactosamine-N,N'-diacetylbacillosaminyl-diphospho-undecaprenol 4-alpha-N-acetylgalactosaminyltransferase
MIQPNKKLKIALVGYRLSGGGAEKVMANLSLFLDSKGIEVHIITVINQINYDYAGILHNLGLLKNESNNFYNKWVRLKALRQCINTNNFDFVIDFRFRTKIIQEFIIARYIYPKSTIFSIRSYLINHYIPDNYWITKLMYSNCIANVVITEQTKMLIEEVHNLNNVVVIENPIDFKNINLLKLEPISLNYSYIIAVGQYENDIKQLDKLIKSYAQSKLPEKGIHLVIIGNGDTQKLHSVATDFSVLEKVHLLGYQNNVYKYFKNAFFTVLSSKNEGMPNVLLESLACGTPVVSFNCKSGPAEIINHLENGILVEDQNFNELTNSLNIFIQNPSLYQICKDNSMQSVEKFSLENIGNKWLKLLNT